MQIKLREFGTAFAPQIDTVLDEFYAVFGSRPELQEIFKSPEHQTRARNAQRVHWLDWVFAGRFDDSYFQRAKQIGAVHQHMGVALSWYLAGYRYLLTRANQCALEVYRDDPRRLADAMSAIQTAVFLDMDISSSVYVQEEHHLLEQLAHKDYLTDVLNRRGLEATATSLFALTERYQTQISVAMVDIDFFKKVNDIRGHAVGDVALQAMAATLKDVSRTADIVARVGGEEFVVVMPQTSIAAASVMAERMRKRIEEMVIPDPEHGEFSVTASLGVAENTSGVGLDDTLKRADDALYKAKHSGRNCVRAAV